MRGFYRCTCVNCSGSPRNENHGEYGIQRNVTVPNEQRCSAATHSDERSPACRPCQSLREWTRVLNCQPTQCVTAQFPTQQHGDSPHRDELIRDGSPHQRGDDKRWKDDLPPHPTRLFGHRSDALLVESRLIDRPPATVRKAWAQGASNAGSAFMPKTLHIASVRLRTPSAR